MASFTLARWSRGAGIGLAPGSGWKSAGKVWLAAAATAAVAWGSPAPTTGCLRCHRGLAAIRQPGSKMLAGIRTRGRAADDPAGCTVCHGGDPQATGKAKAHGDRAFYPDPGSPWINSNTCGTCHPQQVRVQWQSLMMTEAGKIQGTCWSFGALTGYTHKYANYDVENPGDPEDRLGTANYRAYKERLELLEPQVFVERMKGLPPAPIDSKEVAKHPERAAFTYMRNQCQRCHLAVKGRQKRGDYRGMGCSACHIPYSTEGLYEGKDPSISRTEPGHMLVHTIQAGRKAKVSVHGVTYSGIPINTCTVCHNRGKRIGVSFSGLMETPYSTPFAEDGGPQPKTHTKHYLAMKQDVHYQRGMVCQDCHTSLDVHGDGCLSGSNLGSVEIECSDCHGTPTKYPWELPLGFGDEFSTDKSTGPPRGTLEEVLPVSRQGSVYDPEDGYLVTARGNPFPEVVRRGEEVVVHTASGKDLTLKPLKSAAQEKHLSLAGQVAMVNVTQHVDDMECYTCHSSWAPQCYGCHVRIDYSRGKTSFDYLASGRRHQLPAHRADGSEKGYGTNLLGAVEEGRSYTRWEEPMLGVNGEHRVTPLAPGCQTVVTVLGADGKPILLNHIFRTPPNMEGGGAEGQLCIDMSPGQPHTTTEHARSCESCHASDKALGYGIGGGRTRRPPDQPLIVDLETVDHRVLAHNARVQAEPIPGLTADWSCIVTRQGKQLQTVGHHFKGSRPLNNGERAHMDRRGVCLGCHQEIPTRSLAVGLLHHAAEHLGRIPKTSRQHDALIHKILLFAAWGQVLGGAGGGVLVVLLAAGVWRRRRRGAA